MTTNEDLDRLRLAAEGAAGGPPSAEQVDALIAYADALEAELAARQPSEDEWCREESCVHRHWRSGGMPTHRRGDDCPATAAVPDAREHLHAKCDCVPDLGPAHCHLCSADGSPVEWANCVAVQHVTDAPETVEVAFKTVEVERLGHLLVQLSPATPRNGAATVRRLMEEMNIKEVVS